MPDMTIEAWGVKLAGVAGALISMQFLRGTWRSRLAMAVSGAVLAYYASDYVSHRTGLPEGLTGFLVGFFGIAVVSKVWEWFQTAPLGELLTAKLKAWMEK